MQEFLRKEFLHIINLAHVIQIKNENVIFKGLSSFKTRAMLYDIILRVRFIAIKKKGVWDNLVPTK